MCIFSRQKSTTINFIDQNTLKAEAWMADNFHEFKISLTFETKTGKIIEARAEAVRTPFDMCREVTNKIKEIIGLTVEPGINKKVEAIMGRNHGCIHLVDLIRESFKGFVQASGFCLFHPELCLEERLEKIKEANVGICYVYSNLDKNPKYIGPEKF